MAREDTHVQDAAQPIMESQSSSSASSTLTNMALWMFIPSFLTKFLLDKYYMIKHGRQSTRRPKPGSPKYRKHYNVMYSLVILGYFLYCMAEAVYSLEPSYYGKLGIRRSDAPLNLKKRMRQLMLQHHPDKNPRGNLNAYIEMKAMSDILENPNMCNVYEKFGESGVKNVIQNTSKKTFMNAHETQREYIQSTLTEWITFYAGTFLVLVLLSTTSRTESGRFWRFVSLIFLGAFECLTYFADFTDLGAIGYSSKFTLLQPRTWLSFLFADMPIYQRIALLRKLFVYSGMAMSQLGPVWFPKRMDLFEDKEELEKYLTEVCNATEADLTGEIGRIFKSEFGPYRDNPEMMSVLKRKMGQLALNLKLRDMMNDESESKKNR